jgi:hypothetical protein
MVIVVAAAEDYHPKLLLEEGLDFILSHFEEPILPRTISTRTTEARQVLVYNREEALARFKQANFLDCRISAYSDYVEFEGINRQSPNFIFIDLDRSGFKTERAHKLALSLTLKNIQEKLSGNPTCLWSGNGYHVYQPMDAFVLEREKPFSEFGRPSKEFLKFAELYLTNYKSDPSHHPSFKSCMIRIPGSHNSKLVERNNNNGIVAADESTEVRTMQRWDRNRPKINLLLGSFLAYLVDLKFKEIEQQQKQRFSRYSSRSTSTTSNSVILWIEKLLQTPIEDHRKITVSLILTPYLVNIKKLPYDESYNIINGWLDKCNSLRRLDSGFSLRIKHALENAIKTGYKPMRFENLKKRNMALYHTLSQ